MEVRKRKQRAILSCNDCRRRKLKCDRELPCNRCTGGGYPEKCAYNFVEGHCEAEKTPKRFRTFSSHTLQYESRELEAASNDRIGDLERQVQELKETVRSLRYKYEGAGGDREEDVDVSDSGDCEASVGLFKGKAYRTFYYGPTSPVTIVAHVRFSSILTLCLRQPIIKES